MYQLRPIGVIVSLNFNSDNCPQGKYSLLLEYILYKSYFIPLVFQVKDVHRSQFRQYKFYSASEGPLHMFQCLIFFGDKLSVFFWNFIEERCLTSYSTLVLNINSLIVLFQLDYCHV